MKFHHWLAGLVGWLSARWVGLLGGWRAGCLRREISIFFQFVDACFTI